LGVESLRGFLSRHRRIALDTSIFIYQLESNPRYVFYTDHIFSWLERPGSQAVTSSITMTELLVQPFRDADKRRVAEVYGLLSTLPSLEWIAPSLEIAALAARMRALHRMRTPDALQAATAVNALATGLITNDSVFERVEDIEALVIEKLLA